MQASKSLSKAIPWTRVAACAIFLIVFFGVLLSMFWHPNPAKGFGIATIVTAAVALQMWRDHWQVRSSGSGSGDAGFSPSGSGSCGDGGGCSG
ncbi:hypothetical protein E2C06_33655 [Dankookia rubra]|uniref:Uncharacterized protein n=1 Tax=Dankookia rubra TaxID=1442381 RepID=A0A4R5Q6B2_9PROT|nr:hypothetical protein [Dankookia rubra]TDH58236.1 hypothetical protein E2C06_33655 [Dankookia rubra]